MKIAIVLDSFPIVSQTFIVNQITDLIDKGHEVIIFANKENEKEILHQKVLDYSLLDKVIYKRDVYIKKPLRYFHFIKFLYLNRKYLNYSRLAKLFSYKQYGKKAFNLRNYTRYKWILDHAPFDIIHAHFGMDGIPIAEMRTLGYFAKTGFVTSFHGYDISPHLMDSYPNKYKILFEEVDLIISNTEYTKSLLLKITDQEKITVLPVGLDSNEFRKIQPNQEKNFRLLFVGRLIEFKAPHLAIEIVKNLVHRGYDKIKFIIVGEGELRQELQESIQTYGLKNNVQLLGAQPQQDIIKIMDNCDIFLYPGIYDKTGRSENQGLVLQEAQAMELPVVISDVGGMQEGVIDGETGFVVKENDIETFSGRIEYLINNKEERIRMGRKGRNYIVNNYDSKILGKKLVENYLKSIGN